MLPRKSLCWPCSRWSVERRRELNIKPQTVLSETIQNFCGNFVAPKSTDSLQLGHLFWEAVDCTDGAEMGVREEVMTLHQRVPLRLSDNVKDGGQGGKDLTMKVHLAQYCQNQRCSFPIQTVLYKLSMSQYQEIFQCANVGFWPHSHRGTRITSGSC